MKQAFLPFPRGSRIQWILKKMTPNEYRNHLLTE
ncbi:IS3 family transposase [Paenibacillus sp. VCA1]